MRFNFAWSFRNKTEELISNNNKHFFTTVYEYCSIIKLLLEIKGKNVN